MRTCPTFLVASIVSLSALAVAPGCDQYTKPVGPAVEMTPQQKNYDACWRASLDVLREFYFTIDIRDYRGGQIKTQPLLGRYVCEFWRQDAVTLMDICEGSIQTVYRTAVVQIRPTSKGAETYNATVEVTTTRSDRVKPGGQGVADAYEMFVLPGAMVTDMNLLGEADTPDEAARADRRKGLVNLGPDQGLADRLTDRINARTQKFLSNPDGK